jgi:hypothetical protein
MNQHNKTLADHDLTKEETFVLLNQAFGEDDFLSPLRYEQLESDYDEYAEHSHFPDGNNQYTTHIFANTSCRQCAKTD